MIWVAKDAVDAEHFGQQWMPLVLSIWMIFNYHRYDFLPMNYEIVD